MDESKKSTPEQPLSNDPIEKESNIGDQTFKK